MNTTTIATAQGSTSTPTDSNVIDPTAGMNADTTGNAPTVEQEIPGTEETEETKRHRASPRTKAFNEALELISTYIGGWENDNEGNKEGAAQVVEVLSHLRDKLTTIRDNGPVAPTYNGKHYVGITRTGERTQFQANTVPTKVSHGAHFASVVGPFRMKEGAAYVVKNGARPTDKVVFSA